MPAFAKPGAFAKTRTFAKTRALTETRTLVDRSRYLAWNALTVLVFVILMAYVARADEVVMAAAAG
ncbi:MULTISPECIES: hypothetical protein [Methylobacterium]|uniref:hypothetical protein n=1 Tax=Methylobacterium TaxID=407 RepID=UPI0013EE36E7|nr:hypothetical protein [Methylobacterium sp. DB0501]NGM38754.1 hypothetical protein [Methylobacterium sp. DB0501]